MIKFIVLFSLALAGHKARGLMLRGSGQILQRPNFINSESQLDAKKSFLQSNKKRGKSLLKTNLYLQQEDKQEQSYLQGKKEDLIKIQVLLLKTKEDVDPENIYKGLSLLMLDGRSPLDVFERLVEKAATGDIKETDWGIPLLWSVHNIGKGKPRFSKDQIEDLSINILYGIEGREKAIKYQLARIGEEGNAEKIDKGLSYLHGWYGYQQLKYLTKLVDKRKNGETADKRKAQDCINHLSEFGSRQPPASEAEELTNRIESLVDKKS